MLTYYSETHGRVRFKRRYVWGLWAFVGGLALGTLLGHLM